MRRNWTFTLLAALVLTVASRGAGVTTTDICVYGATSGGVTAAVKAARMGKSVVLLSPNAHVGGMTSSGLGYTDYGNSNTIGGEALEFYKGIGQRYGSTSAQYTFEPHIAEQVFNSMLSTAGVAVITNQQLAGVTMNGRRIAQITMGDGSVYQASMFIDATYEGDLMAAAGVSWTMGRESSANYGESLAGVTAISTVMQFPVNVDPYLTPGVPTSGLLPLVQSGSGGNVGDADAGLQAYAYRLCLTTTTSNQAAITAPAGYTEARYELLGRLLDARVAAGNTIALTDFLTFTAMPNAKTDDNNYGPISTDYIAGNANYITGTFAQRAQIAQDHLQYTQGLLYYLGHSTRVPASVRTQMLGYGLCLDEFQDNGGWPNQLYVRESRRMVSDYVMQQGDCVGSRMVDDSIGLASYAIDSHSVQRIVKSGFAANEGIAQRQVLEPYRISYRSIVPRVGECENLLVPWSLSASHIAFDSLRMEPVFMMVGQSAATAAAFAIDDNVPVQQVNYSKLAAQLLADTQVLTWNTTDSLGIVMDNTDASGVTTTGTWTASATTDGYLGANYLQDGNTGKGTKSILFTPTIPTTGDYDVFLRWTSNTNRATNVPVDVTYAGGTTTFTVNEQSNGGAWRQLNTSGPLTFNAGTSGSVLVRTTGTNGFVIADSVRFAPHVTIAPAVQIIATDAVARKASTSDTALVTITRDSSQTASAWTVSYAVGGTGVPGADYVALPGSATIPAGQTKVKIPVTAIASNLVQGGETVTLTLAAGSSFSVGTNGTATVQILDKPVVQIVATSTTTGESDPSTPALFTVSRDAIQTASDWTVSYAIGGSAVAGSHYLSLPGSVVIPAGQTSATIAVTPIADNIAEGTRTVALTLQPGTAFAVGTNGAATVQILDKPIDAWRFANFTAAQLADPTISGDSANPNGDGISNLAKYAFGLAPLIHVSSATTLGWDATGHLTLSYRHWQQATDITVIAEGSNDLQTWLSDSSMVQEVARSSQGGFDLVTVRLVPLTPNHGFLRVRVTRP